MKNMMPEFAWRAYLENAGKGALLRVRRKSSLKLLKKLVGCSRAMLPFSLHCRVVTI